MKTSLVWFKNDLRVQDNSSLQKAIEESDRVIGVYFFDPRLFEKDRFGFKKIERYRTKFLIETIENLKQNLEACNISLLIYNKKPETVFPLLAKEFNINTIFLQKEWTAEEVDTIKKVKNTMKELEVDFVEQYDQLLFHPDDIPFDICSIPKIFTEFRKKCEKQVSVKEPLSIQKLSVENKVDKHTISPKLNDLGFDDFDIDARSAFPYKGGETAALERLQQYFWDSKKLSYYKKTRNGLVGTDYSSKFSAWLANGSISARTIYHQVKKYEQTIQKNDSTYWLIFELIWRDFFKFISLKHQNNIFKLGGILQKDYVWGNNEDLIKQWINGATKEPFVNANMIELKKTGWMSNRGRQNVASFFAKEQELDWRIGAAYFESMLIDYDVHSNYGNWMYVAGVGNDPRDRKFNIKLQAKRYDADRKFQKLWLQNTLF